MNSDYSFIINKPIDYSCLDSTNQHISNSNYILNIISPTCEDCYVNLNKWELIASQNKKLQKKIIFLIRYLKSRFFQDLIMSYPLTR